MENFGKTAVAGLGSKGLSWEEMGVYDVLCHDTTRLALRMRFEFIIITTL